MNKYVKKVAEILSNQRTYNRVKRVYRVAMAASTIACVTIVPAFAADPLSAINKLSEFIFSIIKVVGLISAGWGLLQVGLSVQSHDPSQRTQGILCLVGGLIMFFAKEILTLITSG